MRLQPNRTIFAADTGHGHYDGRSLALELFKSMMAASAVENCMDAGETEALLRTIAGIGT